MGHDELADLPLKSLELPSKTVAKLKPLGIKTVRDLYTHGAAELAAVGLTARELAELEEAAPTFGVAWKAGLAPTPAPPPATRKLARPRQETTAKRLAMPDDLVEAFAADAAAPLRLTADELTFFDGYVDPTGRHFKTPPPSSRFLRLVRRLAVLRAGSIGGDKRTYVVGLIDISQLPAANETSLMHVANLLADVLKRIGAKPRAQGLVGCAVNLTIVEKDAPKARALAAAHAHWIADGPLFLAPVPPALKGWAEAALASLAG